jgi:hypothetical protein
VHAWSPMRSGTPGEPKSHCARAHILPSDHGHRPYRRSSPANASLRPRSAQPPCRHHGQTPASYLRSASPSRREVVVAARTVGCFSGGWGPVVVRRQVPPREIVPGGSAPPVPGRIRRELRRCSHASKRIRQPILKPSRLTRHHSRRAGRWHRSTPGAKNCTGCSASNPLRRGRAVSEVF